ncbi:MAG: sigma-70 family RNA polymerase sigma factor [Clostridium sp.]|nr:sigma-70 family RNA polymerase sigma factor [Clostridium sp.]
MTEKEMRVEMTEKMLRGEGRAYLDAITWNSDRLQWLLKESETRNKKLSEVTGIRESSLKMYESGWAKPGLGALIKLADYFHVPVDFLLGRCSEREDKEIFEHFADYFRVLRDASYDAYLINKYVGDDYIKSDKVFSWPYNLVENIYRVEGNEAVECSLDGLKEAISTLTDREQRIVYMRYREDMTLDEIAAEEQVGRERVRQILAKACRKLRHPTRIRLIQYGIAGTEKLRELRDREREIVVREQELDDREAAIAEREKAQGVPVPEKEEPAKPDEPLSNLRHEIEDYDLSVRSYNCLKRAGCKTMEDVAKVAESGGLLRIRNMGRRSAEEVLGVLKEKCGLDYSALYFAA